MRAGWTARLVVAAALLGIVTVAGSAVGSVTERVATEGDTYTVSSERLRDELTRAGLDIRYVVAGRQLRPAISGLATYAGEAIGFEFQMYPTSDEATIRDLGRLKLGDFGWHGPRRGLFFEKKIRGVLANVAYAQYEIQPRGRSRTIRAYLRLDRLRRFIRRSLDEALFRAFPEDDSYAYPLETDPT